MSYHELLVDPRFFLFLLLIDRDIADHFRQLKCPRCGCSLDCAHFWRRKGFGIPKGADDECLRRLSFCCRRRGCRARLTPPSVRFLPGKNYLTVVIVLVTAMKHGLDDQRRKTLAGSLGISRQALAKWQRWWREVFETSKLRRGWQIRTPVATDADAPSTLLTQCRPPDLLPWKAIVLVCALVGSIALGDHEPVVSLVRGHLSRVGFTQTWCDDHPSSGT